MCRSWRLRQRPGGRMDARQRLLSGRAFGVALLLSLLRLQLRIPLLSPPLSPIYDQKKTAYDESG